MLKMMTFSQDLSRALDFSRSPQKLPSMSEGDSEASVSEASSEDLVPPLEAKVALEGNGNESMKKKKKKPKGLANMFNVFIKGRKKKAQPSSAEPEGKAEPQPELGGRLPTGRLGPQVGLEARVRAGQAWAGLGLTGWWPAYPGHREGRGDSFGGVSPPGFHMHPYLILAAGNRSV